MFKKVNFIRVTLQLSYSTLYDIFKIKIELFVPGSLRDLPHISLTMSRASFVFTVGEGCTILETLLMSHLGGVFLDMESLVLERDI